LWIGVAITITMLVSLIAYNFIQSALFISIADPMARIIGREIWDVVTAGLVTQTILIMVIGILIAVGAWLAGPNPRAATFRSWTQERVSALRNRGD
jgi:predicted PurR-regulated permease PerM